MGFSEAEILTDAGRTGFTVMVTVFDVTGLPVTQGAFDVITQTMVLPFSSEELE